MAQVRAGRAVRAGGCAASACAAARSLVAVVVVVVAMLVGGTGLVLVLEQSLEQAVEATGRARAAEVVSRIDANGVRTTVDSLSDQSRTDAVTLLLDDQGPVVGSSRRSATTAALDPAPRRRRLRLRRAATSTPSTRAGSGRSSRRR